MATGRSRLLSIDEIANISINLSNFLGEFPCLKVVGPVRGSQVITDHIRPQFHQPARQQRPVKPAWLLIGLVLLL
jgi:hypothetical protein